MYCYSYTQLKNSKLKGCPHLLLTVCDTYFRLTVENVPKSKSQHYVVPRLYLIFPFFMSTAHLFKRNKPLLRISIRNVKCISKVGSREGLVFNFQHPNSIRVFSTSYSTPWKRILNKTHSCYINCMSMECSWIRKYLLATYPEVVWNSMKPF